MRAVKQPNAEQDRSPPVLCSIALVILLYLMYSSPFLTDYLMNDEWANIGSSRTTLSRAITESYFVYGRGLFGLFDQLAYGFAGYEPGRIQFIRFLNFASIAAVAVLLLRFLTPKTQSSYFAFCTMLLWLSHPAFQGLMGYSLQLISSQPAIWFSLAAFYLWFFVCPRWGIPKPIGIGAVFLILALSMQSNQTFAFFAAIPLSYLALTDWKNQKNRVLTFLLIAAIVLILSSIAYKISLDFWHSQGNRGYRLGEDSIAALSQNPAPVILHALNPIAYWSVFKIWTFPFPLHNAVPIPEIRQMIIATAIMALWLALIIGSIVIEIKSNGKQTCRDTLAKWLAVLFCFALGAVFVVADSPQQIIEHRPHILLTLTGLVVFTSNYSFGMLASRYAFLHTPVIRAVVGIAVCSLAFGAQAGLARNIVNVRAQQINFIRTELIRQSSSPFRKVIVVLPRWNGCVTEPCGPWIGHLTESDWHLRQPGAYRYAMATVAISPRDKQMVFVEQEPATKPNNSAVINWNIYSAAQQRYGEHLGSNAPVK